MVNTGPVDRLLITATKTVLGYIVFFVFLFTIPIYNGFKNSDFVHAFIGQKNAVIGETAIKIDIADSYDERVKGLSGKSFLPDNTGLFFIFDNPGYHGIWMKDMRIPIDIVWLDDSLQVVHLEQEISPNTYPEVFKPNKKAIYILEVPSGFIYKNSIKIADQMTIL